MATKRELTEQQQWDVEVEEVHAIVNEIRAALADGREALWRVARGVHAFNELRGWQKLGHDTLGEWLAEPDIGWSRTQYFRYVGVWQKYALDRKVDPQRLQQVDLTKAEVVLPALKAGDVTADTALADIEALGWRDLREKYVTKAKSSPSAGTDSATTPTDTSGSKPGEQPEPEDWEPPTAAAGAPSVPDDAPATGELVDEFDPADPNVVTPEEAREELWMALNRDDPAPVSHATIRYCLELSESGWREYCASSRRVRRERRRVVTDRPDSDFAHVPGQMDVDECIEIAERDHSDQSRTLIPHLGKESARPVLGAFGDAHRGVGGGTSGSRPIEHR